MNRALAIALPGTSALSCSVASTQGFLFSFGPEKGLIPKRRRCGFLLSFWVFSDVVDTWGSACGPDIAGSGGGPLGPVPAVLGSADSPVSSPIGSQARPCVCTVRHVGEQTDYQVAFFPGAIASAFAEAHAQLGLTPPAVCRVVEGPQDRVVQHGEVVCITTISEAIVASASSDSLESVPESDSVPHAASAPHSPIGLFPSVHANSVPSAVHSGVPSAVPSVVPSASVFPTRPPASSASGPNPSGSAPCLSSLEECFRARRDCMPAHLRVAQAAQFGDLWGDDEVLFHLRKLAQGAVGQHAVVMDPLIPTSAVHHDVPVFTQWWHNHLLPVGTVVLSALWVSDHWVPLLWRITQAGLTLESQDATTEHAPKLHKLDSQIPAFFTHSAPTKIRMHPCTQHLPCGPAAIRFFAACAIDQVFHLPDSGVASLLRRQFLEEVQAAGQVIKPWLWGGAGHPPAEVVRALTDVLVAHGVPEGAADARARSALDVLGVLPAQSAIQSNAQWKALKTLGNQHKPAFQWIHPAELQAQIEARAQQGKPVGRKAAKAAKKGSKKTQSKPAPIHIEPAQVQIAKGTFMQMPDIALAQISLPAIGPCAAGVVLATPEEAATYVRASKPISSQALGLIVVGHGANGTVPIERPSEPVQFPAICLSTGDPILLTGVLCQLGERKCQVFRPEQPLSVEVAKSVVLKVLVFRDQVVAPWEGIAIRPVKYVTEQLPLLRLCRQADCQCPCWHNADKVPTQAFLDLWRRQFLDARNRMAEPTQAVQFSCNVRVPEELVNPLLRQAGHGGIFTEPRSEDGKVPCPAFSVVWLPEATLHEATVVKQSHIMAVGLARNGDRYGVRTRAADAAAIHAAVRPGVPFMGGSVKHVYEVGPLPFGTQRESLQKWLDEWKWCARPLQAGSVSPDRSGVMWKVQASSEPPSATAHLAHGPVVITQVPTKPIAEPTAVPVVAHSRTMQVMKGAPAPVGEDPWLKGDPWLQARGVTAAAAHPPAPSVPNLEEQVAIAVQARLDRSVQAMQVDAGMQQHSADDAHHRITELETKLFDAQAAHAAAADQRINAIEGQVQQIGQAVHRAEAKADATQNQLEGLFASQMQKIEALLRKPSFATRSRSRGE